MDDQTRDTRSIGTRLDDIARAVAWVGYVLVFASVAVVTMLAALVAALAKAN